MTKKFTRQFKVRWSEVGAANRVPASKFMEYLVETAYDWGATKGFSIEDSRELGLLWIILETDIRLVRPLRFSDEIDFSIWMVEWRKIRGNRAFEIRLKDSEIIVAQGMQKVVVLDAVTLRPKVAPAEIIDGFRMDDPRSFAMQPFPKLGEKSGKKFAIQRRVEWGELDSLVHLNNGEALRYVDEVLMQFLASLGWPAKRFFDEGLVPVDHRVHIKYQEAGLWADELKIETYPLDVEEDEVSNAILVTRESDGKSIFQALYRWGLVDLKSDEARLLPQELLDGIKLQIET